MSTPLPRITIDPNTTSLAVTVLRSTLWYWIAALFGTAVTVQHLIIDRGATGYPSTVVATICAVRLFDHYRTRRAIDRALKADR